MADLMAEPTEDEKRLTTILRRCFPQPGLAASYARWLIEEGVTPPAVRPETGPLWTVDEHEPNTVVGGDRQKVRCYQARGSEWDNDLAMRLADLLDADDRERGGLAVQLAECRDIIVELTNERNRFRDLCGRHDSTGEDHLADAVRLTEENDELREAARALTEALAGQADSLPEFTRLVALLDAADGTDEAETAAILADPDTMAALAEAEADMAAGRVTEAE